MIEIADLSPKWPTVFELAAQIPQVDLTGKRARGGKNRPPVTQGIVPEPFPFKQGYFEVTPEQVCSLIVPRIEVDGDIRGFQREKTNSHARKIARAMLAGDEMPPISCTIFVDDKGEVLINHVYLDDGQHRALGGVIARQPLEVIVKHRTFEKARKLFANQSKAKNLRSDDTLLTGNSPIELYIQDAVTSDDHPWSDLVSAYKSERKMTPTSMAIIVGSFVFNSMNMGVQYLISRPEEDFDVNQADRLASLIRSFGNRTTNPLAFRARSLRAISYAAIHIFRRNPNTKDDDVERWKRHMPQFHFDNFPNLLNREQELAVALVDHWNKRLPEERKVKPWTYR